MTLLTQAPEGAALSRGALAAYYGLPDAYLAKHLHALVRTGLLHASTGPRGGFRLARQPEDITVLDIVEAIDGSTRPFVCKEIRQQGTGAYPAEACRRPCTINVVMTRAHNAWRTSLRDVTLADLSTSLPAAARARQRTLFDRTGA